MFHVRTDLNAADLGTRPDKVRIEDVLPGSTWHNGYKWMTCPLTEAVQDGSIVPVSDLKISDSEQEEYKEGIIFNKIPELLTRGHVLNKERIDRIEERARFSNYVILPTKFNFKRSFHITMLVIKFVMKCRKGKLFCGPKLSSPIEKCPSIFAIDQRYTLDPNIKNATENLLSFDAMITEESCRQLALTYLFRTAALEVKEFVKHDSLLKIAVEANGILFSKSRLLESMEFQKVSRMEMVSLEPLGFNMKTPVLDRYSPLAYSVAQYIHYVVSGHGGLETCNRLSLERVFIIQGISL